MHSHQTAKLCVFVDADVIFAGSTARSEFGASLVVLLMGEITLVDAITSQQAITEVERNLTTKLPDKVAEFQLLVRRCLRIVADPTPADLIPFAGQADKKDLPLLVAALREQCDYFLTFNTRHFYPQDTQLRVQRPGEFLSTARAILSRMRPS
jgi:predicted nucleic acid-binding protein